MLLVCASRDTTPHHTTQNAALPKALIPNELAAVASPGDGADSGAADSESKAVSVEDLVAEVVASTLRGDELAAFAKDKLAGREDDVAQPLMRALMMAQHVRCGVVCCWCTVGVCRAVVLWWLLAPLLLILTFRLVLMRCCGRRHRRPAR